jgi:hypothetical protein
VRGVHLRIVPSSVCAFSDVPVRWYVPVGETMEVKAFVVGLCSHAASMAVLNRLGSFVSASSSWNE